MPTEEEEFPLTSKVSNRTIKMSYKLQIYIKSHCYLCRNITRLYFQNAWHTAQDLKKPRDYWRSWLPKCVAYVKNKA